MLEPDKLPILDFEQAMSLLRDGELSEVHGLLPWGSNYTFLMSVASGDCQSLAVYKPRQGEQPLWDFPRGTLCLREAAAFVVSQALGWNIVPPTVLRDGPHGYGSLQLYVPHDPDQHYFTFGPSHRKQLRRIALFDYIINNADRKGGHCLIDHLGFIWAIDHGIAFHAHDKLRTVIWDFAGSAIPKELLSDLQRLCADLSHGTLVEELELLLLPAEIRALRRRTTQLVDFAVYPEPGSGRSYPWPPI